MLSGLGWQIFALGAAVFAALTALFGKLGVSEFNSNFATFIRTIIIVVMTAAIVSFRHEWEPLHKISGRGLLFLGLSGVATGLSWLCYYRALQLGPVSKVAPVDKLSVALVIILGVVVLREPLTWATAIGGGLIVAGSLILAFS